VEAFPNLPKLVYSSKRGATIYIVRWNGEGITCNMGCMRKLSTFTDKSEIDRTHLFIDISHNLLSSELSLGVNKILPMDNYGTINSGYSE
jgi:hypothetical protein